MKTISLVLAALTIVSVGAAAAPSLAATVKASSAAPFCSSSGEDLNMQKSQLAQQLQLRTKLNPTIDDWNGCLKVQYTDANGHANVAIYDPDSGKIIDQVS